MQDVELSRTGCGKSGTALSFTAILQRPPRPNAQSGNAGLDGASGQSAVTIESIGADELRFETQLDA